MHLLPCGPPGPGGCRVARLSILGDTSVAALLDDGACLRLHPRGGVFTHWRPPPACAGTSPPSQAGTDTARQAERTQQLSEYALHRFQPALCQALAIRNAYVDVPYFCVALVQATRRDHFTLNCVLEEVRWPASLQEAQQAQLVRVDEGEGSITVHCVDRVAHVRHHCGHLGFCVTYPLLLSAVEGNDLAGVYTWHTQAFLLSEHPDRWTPAVRLVQAWARSVHQGRSGSMSGMLPGDAESLCDAPNQVLRLSCTTTLPRATARAESDACQCSTFDWVPQPSSTFVSYPADVPLLQEWTPAAIHTFVKKIREVHSCLASNQGCLRTTCSGKFIDIMKPQINWCNTYASSAIPDCLTVGKPNERRCLGDACAFALKYRAAAATSDRSMDREKGLSQVATHDSVHSCHKPEEYSIVVHQNQVVDGIGQFWAYEDGRVKGIFVDRTIVYLNSFRGGCSILTSDGKQLSFSYDCPIGYGHYVGVAKEFLAWAFKSPLQRAEELRMAAQVELEAHQTMRMAVMCAWAARRALPPALDAVTPPAGPRDPTQPCPTARRHPCASAAHHPLKQPQCQLMAGSSQPGSGMVHHVMGVDVHQKRSLCSPSKSRNRYGESISDLESAASSSSATTAYSECCASRVLDSCSESSELSDQVPDIPADLSLDQLTDFEYVNSQARVEDCLKRTAQLLDIL